MTARRRWGVVVAGTALLVAAPFVVSRLPAGSSSITASELLRRIASSADVAYSGYAESVGGVSLPVTDSDFNDLADLLGGTADLRVWWRGASDWRVDAVGLTGERDVAQDSTGTWTWDYEDNRARRTPFVTPPAVRLPRSDDLLPGTLARRLLSDARPDEVSRLADARIAGRDAAGLRLRPSSPDSTIGRVDVWALPSSGLPLRIEVYGRSGPAVVRTSLLDLDTSRPARSATSFEPPPGARVETDNLPDLAAAIDRFAPVRAPTQLAGLDTARTLAGTLGSVGVYGRGVTVLVAVPLPPSLGDLLLQRFGGAVGAAASDGGAALGVGPINLRLTPPSPDGARWLLAGTVTAATLQTAQGELPAAQAFFR
jgi:hypothetical protein